LFGTWCADRDRKLNEPSRCRSNEGSTNLHVDSSTVTNNANERCPPARNDGARYSGMMSLVDYSSSEDEQNEESALKVANETSRTITKPPSLPTDFYDLYSGTSFLRLD
jgi:hypothetical protein